MHTDVHGIDGQYARHEYSRSGSNYSGRPDTSTSMSNSDQISFVAATSHVHALSKTVELLYNICTNVNLRCDVSGLFVQAMSNTCMASVKLRIPRRLFHTYTCRRPIRLGLDVRAWSHVLSISCDTVLMKYDAPHTCLQLELLSGHADTVTTFTLQLMQLDEEEYTFPRHEYTMSFTLPSNVLFSMLRKLDEIAETIRLSITSDGLVRVEAGDDFIEARLHTRPTTLFVVRSSSTRNLDYLAALQYSLSHLLGVCDTASFAHSAELHVGVGCPLFLRYRFDVDTEASCEILLAPSIDD